jgi:histidinol-phosphate aminotransferase
MPSPNPLLSQIHRLREGGSERIGFIGLDRNERISDLPPEVVDEIRERIGSNTLTTYPVTKPLHDAVAQSLGVGSDQVLLTPGSDAAVKAFFHVYSEPGTTAVMLEPSYAMYPIYAQMFGTRPRPIPFAADLTVNREELLAAVDDDVRLVLLANPNQPTGTVLSDELIEELLIKAAGLGALVLVDEAYYPFSGNSLLPLLPLHDNLVITRTFSKAWGLAGARVGFVIADPSVISNLYKVRSAYDVSALSAECASVMLAHPEVAAAYVAEVEAGRDLLSKRAKLMGLTPLPSLTNFQLLELSSSDEPSQIVERLYDLGYLVKGPFTAPCLQDCIRVTLGPPAMMDDFADALAASLEDR